PNMYNGIGLQTARGTGTNGYVQANLSNLLLSRKRVEYNSEADLRRAEAEINRAPNEEILQHQRKRGFDDDEISKKVSDYRKLLLSQLESGELNLDGELDSRDSHARAKAAVQNRDRMRSALGLDKDFIPGSSMKASVRSVNKKAALPQVPKATYQDSDSSSSDNSDESSSDESVERKRTEKQKARKREFIARERRDRRDRKGRAHEGDSSNKRRRDDDRHEDRLEKRRRSRSPSGSSKRRKTRDSHDEDRRRRRRSSSSDRREDRSRRQEKNRDRSPARKVKEEPPSPQSEEEPRRKEKSRQSGSRSEKRKDSYSDDNSDSDSHDDSLRYKMKSADMAFSDDQELIDQIRHDLRMEDYSGVCARCVVPERRRAKFGGLPLNFRSATSSDDEDDPEHKGYCGYEIPALDETVFTKEIIESRLRSRTVERTDTLGQQNVNEKEKVPDELFVPQEIKGVNDTFEARSAVSNDSVDDFQLLMADDSGEIELDLPPLDKGRAIGDLGFTVLAMVSKKGSMSSESKETYRVVVYLPTSEQFVFELDDLDHTLEWLRDETLRRKGTDDSEELDYDLEDVNVFGKPLNLQQSIANSGCLEFVLVRKFSSRGDFHPRGGIYRQKSTALLTPIARTPNTAAFGIDFGTPKMSVCELPSISPGGTSPVYYVEDEELYEGRTWKTVHIEFESAGKALQAKDHMLDVIRALNSPAYQAYQHSLNGIRHPAEAAESALMQMPDGLLPASTRSNKSSILRKLSKFRMTLSAMKD
ncbi:hypothetical protein ANCCEY_12676, partial [Ancylostoma ceylanicum]